MSAESGGGPARLYHDRSRLWRKLAVLAYALLLSTVGLIAAVTAGQEPVALILLVAVAGCAVLGIASVLVFHSGIKVGADGVTIIPVIGTRRHLAWPQVRMFQVMHTAPHRGRVEYGVWVVRHDGQPVTTNSCALTVPVNKDTCPDSISRLAADLEAERQRLGSPLHETGLA